MFIIQILVVIGLAYIGTIFKQRNHITNTLSDRIKSIENRLERFEEKMDRKLTEVWEAIDDLRKEVWKKK